MEYHFVAVLRDDERKFARFYVLERNIPLLASVGAALLATALFPRIGDRLYLISLLGFVTCFVLGTIVLPGGSRGARAPGLGVRAAEVRREIVVAFRSPGLIALVLWLACTQIGFTTLYQFWQMAFMDVGIDSHLFGLLFIAFQGAGILGNWAFGRMVGSRYVLVGTAVASGLLAVVLTLVRLPAVVVGSSLLLGAVILVHANAVEFEFQRAVPETVMSSLASVINALSSAVALAVLSLAGAILDAVSATTVLATGIMTFALVMGAFAAARRRIERRVVDRGAAATAP
jgi:hypothetical protein